jgi:hypothetical protein
MRFFQSKLYEAIEDIAKALAAYAIVIYGATLASRWWADAMVGIRWIMSLFNLVPTPTVFLRQVVATVGIVGVLGMAIARQVRSGRRQWLV